MVKQCIQSQNFPPLFKIHSVNFAPHSNTIHTSTSSTNTTIPKQTEAGQLAKEVEVGADPKPEPQITTNRQKKLGSAARLPHFISKWHQVTSNKFILNIIEYGYKIDFITEPFQSNFIPKQLSLDNLKICKCKVKQFLKNGAIRVVQPSPDQFISNIFPVVKRAKKRMLNYFVSV